MLHSVWILNYHDFQGLYIVTYEWGGERGVDLEGLLVTSDCDPSIEITMEQLQKHGVCIWSPARGI